MSLQYSSPSSDDDAYWAPRWALCHRFLTSLINEWCLNDIEFPVDGAVAVLLRIVGPKFDVQDQGSWNVSVHQWLESTQTAESEFNANWPHRSTTEGAEIVQALTKSISKSLETWTEGHGETPPVDEMLFDVIQVLLDARCVRIHRHVQLRKSWY